MKHLHVTIVVLLSAPAAHAQSAVPDIGSAGSPKRAMTAFIGNLNGTGGIGQLVAGVMALDASAPSPLVMEVSNGTRGRVRAGIRWMHREYESLGDLDLQNGDFQGFKNVRPDPGAVRFPPYYSNAAITLDATSDTTVVFARVAVTNAFDIGVAVPFVGAHAAGSATTFALAGSETTQNRSSTLAPVSSSGIGDVAVAAGYRVWRHGDGGLAALVELRMPTGDPDALSGLGFTRTLVGAAVSGGGRLSPRATIGYEFWSDSLQLTNTGGNNPNGLDLAILKNQVTYDLGVDANLHKRLVFSVDLSGRALRSGGQAAYRTVRGLNRNIDLLVALPDGMRSSVLAPSVKLNVGGGVWLEASVAATLASNGLRPGVVPVITAAFAR